MDWLHGLNDMAINAADSPWVFVVVFCFAAIDALIPIIPSESVVVALAAISVNANHPAPWWLALAAGLGALLGDNLTYRLGRGIGLDRFGWMRSPRMTRAFAAARHELDKRSALLILTARYVPVGRVAVNLTAGATRFPYRRYLPLAIAAASSWALYSVFIGRVAGRWVEQNPLLGSAIAVTLAVFIGFTIDRLVSWKRGRQRDQPAA